MNQKDTDKFWGALSAVGKEVIEQSREMGFGNSIIEVKIKDGTPVIMIRSLSTQHKYISSDEAKIAIARDLEVAQAAGFDGSRTFTLIYNKGNITRIVLDDYKNAVLK